MNPDTAPIGWPTAVISTRQDRPSAQRAAGLHAAGRDHGHPAAFPLVVLLSSLGTLAVAAAYAAGRAGWPYLTALYWPGQLLVYVPIALRAYSSRLARPAEGFALVLLLFVQQTLVFRLYSPLELKFPDELQHWRGTLNVVHSGTLDQANYSLPVAVHYPGLEALGGAVSASTGLSVTATAFIVAALLHLLLAGGLYALCLRISADWRMATLACVIYAANPHYLFFDAMYIYQGLALPFLVLLLWAMRLWRSPDSGGPLASAAAPGGAAGRWIVVLMAIGVVTVSHHITSFVLIAALAGLAVAGACQPRPDRDLRPLVVWLLATSAVVAWALLVARDVGSYLAPTLAQLGDSAAGLVHGHAAATGIEAAPLWERLVTVGTLVFLAVLVVRGSRDLWPRRRGEPWALPLIAGALLIFALGPLRLIASDGAELSGRAATFIYIPVAIVAAMTLCRPPRSDPALRRGVGRIAAGAARMAAAAVIVLGGIASGWPPAWDRLPGPYLPAGFERSVDPQGIAAARWALSAFGPGHRWAEDLTGQSLLSAVGDQNPVRGVAVLYDGQGADPAARYLVTHLQIRFLAVDLRDSRQLPASGAYFFADPNAGRYRAPLPRAHLKAIGRVAGVSRIYDSGDIELYDLRGSAYDR